MHSPVDEHCDYSQLLAITKKAVRNILYKSLYEHIFSFLLCKFLEVEQLGHMVGVNLNLLRNFQTFLK